MNVSIDALEAMLGQPAAWHYIRDHALHVRDQHGHGSEAWSVLTRLAAVADDITRIAARDRPSPHPSVSG